MLTIKQCRQLLGKNDQDLTDEQIEQLRELLANLLSDIVNDLNQNDHEASSVDVTRVK